MGEACQCLKDSRVVVSGYFKNNTKATDMQVYYMRIMDSLHVLIVLIVLIVDSLGSGVGVLSDNTVGIHVDVPESRTTARGNNHKYSRHKK